MKDRLKKVKKPKQLLKIKQKKLGETKKKVKMQDMSVEDFMSEFMNEDGVESSEENKGSTKKSKKKTEKTKTKKSSKMNGKAVNEEEEEEKDDDEDLSDIDNESNVDDEFTSHKKGLDSLKKSDPEFYKFLEENDKDLLNFDDSDLDSDDEKNEKFHKTPDTLEVASDESDYEPDEEVIKASKGKGNLVTSEMVAKWQEGLKSRNNIHTLREVVEAFHAAVVSVSPEDDATSIYKVEGSTIFNSVIRMCMIDLLPGIEKALKMSDDSKNRPTKCKNWSKVKPILRNYLIDLAELSGVTSPNMLRVLLKHFHQMSPYIACFPSLAPKYFKRVVELWTTDEDVVKVLAFLCTLRLANLRRSLLRNGLKIMYLTYVRNTKFVSPNSLPGINFMRKSLCEMFALDDTTSYHMAFIYIRQLAIHLRNAITMKKKDSYRTVYNWAYVSSLHLWAELFGLVPRNSPLRSLVYPLVQIIIGTIKLIPSAPYFPLRFHCCRILIHISNKCDVFIPILPFLLEILNDFDFNREHKKLSMKPMDLTCLLRCSKSQMKENGFKDALIENIHGLMVEYLAMEAHRVSFPDVTVPCVIQLKQFVKKCSVVNYTKKMKAIVEKIAENSKFIESERKKLNLKLEDLAGVEAAEAGIKAKEPPFLKYFENWQKINLQQQAKRLTNNQKLGDFNLPVLYKLDKKRSRNETAKPVGPPELFPSDDDDSVSGDIFEEEPEPPKKRKKEGKKKEVEQKKVKREQEDDFDYGEDDGEDVLVDLNYSDFK